MKYNKIKSQIDKLLPKKGILEINPQDLTALKKVSLVTLAIIGIAGFVSIALVAPNLFSVLGKIAKFKSKYRTREERANQTSRIFYYLKRRGYICFKESKTQGFWVRLTAKGKKVYKELSYETLKIPKPKKWDKKWWQVAADIPTKEFRRAADLFRLKIKQMHLYPLQRSLWFYPYDPRKEIEFIIKYFRIESFVTVMEINRLDLDDEKVLKKYFKKLHVL